MQTKLTYNPSLNEFKAVVLFFMLFAISGLAFAQNGQDSRGQISDDIEAKFNNYQENNLPEKLYVHTDKDLYLNEEICWFKIYSVDGFFHKPLALSKIVYVEVLNSTNRPVLQAKLGMTEGFGNGSFVIPPTLATGNYTFRAYTSWMKNYGPEFYFEKQIRIINTKRRANKVDAISAKEEIEIAFFPEGGNLVHGLESKVGFHVMKNRKGMASSGLLINETGDTLSRFSSLNLGIGNFTLTPKTGQQYEAILLLEDGTVVRQNLPTAFSDGYVMQLTETDSEQIKIRVQGTNSSAVYLFVHTKGISKSIQKGELLNGEAIFKVDKNILGDGISHFTIFNENGQPVCERLYFKYPTQLFNAKISLDKPIYDTRDKVELQINTTDLKGESIKANMSIAVFQIDSLQTVSELNITNYLWLNSDLVGNVESPNYYFENQGLGKEKAMDNLMLTHGWRRFKWGEMEKKTLEFVPEYMGHIVRGEITNSRSNSPVRGVRGYLTTTSKRSQFASTLSDQAGFVKFEMNDFYNRGEIIVKAKGYGDSLYNLEILSPFSGKYSDTKTFPFSLNQRSSETLTDYHINVEVQNQYAAEKLQRFWSADVDTTAFYLTPDITYLLDDYVRFKTMEDVLREFVNPVLVRKRDGKFNLTLHDSGKNSIFANEPLMLIDGLAIFDADKIMTYDPLKVERIEIVTRAYHLGTLDFDGVLNFITYKGDLPNYRLDPNTTVIDYEGLQLQRDFYSPIYESHEQRENRVPDFRNLLYWSPTVITDENGSQKVAFYSSDRKGKYAIMLQGLTSSGKTGAKVTTFEVK